MDEEFSEVFNLFEKHVPHGHEAFMVLKIHLIVEMRFRVFIKARVNDKNLWKTFEEGKNCNANSGEALTLMARVLATRDEVLPDEIPWKAIEILNSLRNKLAHSLEPKADSISEKMINFVRAMGHDVSKGDNVNQSFRLCAVLLVRRLGRYETPMTMDDTLPFPEPVADMPI